MLLTIHNLPAYMDYSDIKTLIQSKCGLTDVILDNLLQAGVTKKVTVGLGDESDAAILVRKINGIFLAGKQLYVEDLRRKKDSDQPYRSSAALVEESLDTQQYQQSMMVNMAMSNMYYVPVMPQTPFMGYSAQEQPKALLPLPNMDANPQFKQPGFGGDSHRNVSPPKHRHINRGANPNASSSMWDEPPSSRWDSGKSQHHDIGFNREEGEFGSQRPARAGRPELFTTNSINDGPGHKQSTFKDSPWESESFQPRREREGFQRHDQRDQEFSSGSVLDEIIKPRNKQRDEQNRPLQSRRFPGNQNQNDVLFGRIAPQDDGFYSQVQQDVPRNDEYYPQEEPQRDEFYRRHNEVQDNAPYRRNEPQGGPFNRQNELQQEDRSFRRNEPQSDVFRRRKDLQVDEIYHRNEPQEMYSRNRDQSNQRSFVNVSQPRNQERGNTFSLRGPRPDYRREGPMGRRPDPKRFQDFNSYRDGPRPQKPIENRRYDKLAPPKRFNERDNRGEPSPKRFAGVNKGDRSRAPQHSFSNPNMHSNPSIPRMEFQGKGKLYPTQPEDSVQSRTNRDQTWRQQAVANIFKEMVKALEVDDITDMDVQKVLKKKIRERLDSVLPPFNPKTNPMFMLDMVKIYREKYPADDQEFFLAGLEDIEHTIKATEPTNDNKAGIEDAQAEKVDEMVTKSAEQPNGDDKSKPEPSQEPESENTTVTEVPAVTTQEETKNENDPACITKDLPKEQTKTAMQHVNTNAKFTKTNFINPYPLNLRYPPANMWIPQYPNGDKKLHNEQRDLLKMEFEVEDLYDVPAELRPELNEQCDRLCDLFMEACDNPESEAETDVCERITDEIADEFRKVMRVHLTKRILNITSGLLLRIYMQGQSDREIREKFFRRHGILASNKMDKTSFVVTLKTFKHYDELVKMETAVVDGATFTFKPLHLTGPPRKITKQEIQSKRKSFINSQVDKSGVNILKNSGEYDVNVDECLEDTNEEAEFAEDVDVPAFDTGDADNFNEDDLEDY